MAELIKIVPEQVEWEEITPIHYRGWIARQQVDVKLNEDTETWSWLSTDFTGGGRVWEINDLDKCFDDVIARLPQLIEDAFGTEAYLYESPTQPVHDSRNYELSYWSYGSPSFDGGL